MKTNTKSKCNAACTAGAILLVCTALIILIKCCHSKHNYCRSICRNKDKQTDEDAVYGQEATDEEVNDNAN